MEKEILALASASTLWTVLTVFWVFYILKKQERIGLQQEEREKKYQEIIFKLIDKKNIKKDVRS